MIFWTKCNGAVQSILASIGQVLKVAVNQWLWEWKTLFPAIDNTYTHSMLISCSSSFKPDTR